MIAKSLKELRSDHLPEGGKNKQITMYVEPEQVEGLLLIEKETGLPFQVQVRLAIRQFIAREKSKLTPNKFANDNTPQ